MADTKSGEKNSIYIYHENSETTISFQANKQLRLKKKDTDPRQKKWTVAFHASIQDLFNTCRDIFNMNRNTHNKHRNISNKFRDTLDLLAPGHLISLNDAMYDYADLIYPFELEIKQIPQLQLGRLHALTYSQKMTVKVG